VLIACQEEIREEPMPKLSGLADVGMRAAGLVTAALVPAALGLSGAAADTLESGRLILGTIQTATGPTAITSGKFAEWIHEETDGRFTVVVVPAAQLGPALEQYGHTRTGAQHLFADALEWNAQFVRDYGVMAVPFGLRDVDHLLRFLESDLVAEWRQRMEDEFGLVTLTDQLIRSPRIVHSVDHIETFEDMQGMSFRVPEIDVYFESWRAIGVSPTPVAWGEKYFALQQGVISGGEGPFTTILPARFPEISKYILETNHLWSAETIIMHKDTFDRLSPEDQEIFREVAARAAEFYNELVQAEESEHRQIMEQEYGVTFIQPSEEELEKFRAAVADAVPEFEARDMWPEGLYEEMQAVGN
jgi:TRAP-type transport system periplasmic protein